MKDYERDLCVRAFHVYYNIYAMFGSVTPYVSAISGAVAIVCVSFSPFLTWMFFSSTACTS